MCFSVNNDGGIVVDVVVVVVVLSVVNYMSLDKFAAIMNSAKVVLLLLDLLVLF